MFLIILLSTNIFFKAKDGLNHATMFTLRLEPQVIIMEEEIRPILQLIRDAQWYWDYATASHGASFHSPIEVSRIIANGMNASQDARVLLARLMVKLGKTDEIPYPDIATKEKAQKYIGLPMEQLIKDKEEFMKTVIPIWNKKALERENRWKIVIQN